MFKYMFLPCLHTLPCSKNEVEIPNCFCSFLLLLLVNHHVYGIHCPCMSVIYSIVFIFLINFMSVIYLVILDIRFFFFTIKGWYLGIESGAQSTHLVYFYDYDYKTSVLYYFKLIFFNQFHCYLLYTISNRHYIKEYYH